MAEIDLSAYLYVNDNLNAESAEVRREPQRRQRTSNVYSRPFLDQMRLGHWQEAKMLAEIHL